MKRILFSGFIFFTLSALGQTIPTTVNFKTPEVAAFNKFIETPVSYYTGVPNISIPLYEIKIKDVTVPIVLNYHAGGIRVDEEATWVGLGWSLDYGGQVTRKVRGAPDEKYYFSGANNSSTSVDYYLQLPHPTQDPTFADRYDYLNRAKYGNGDYMPDEFYYSTLGYSGRFMFSQEQNKFVLFPKDDLAVQQFSSAPDQNGSTFPLYYWNIKLPNGTSVDLGKDGNTSQLDINTLVSTKNSWQVKNIQNIYNENISYTYSTFSYQQYKISGENYSLHSAGIPPEQSYSLPRFTYKDAHPATITFPNGTIQFVTGPRDDMPTTQLQEIDVKDNAGNVVRKILFHYGYFDGESYDIMSVLGYSSLIPDTWRYERMRLDGITITGATGSPSQNYGFDYYTNANMPSKYSFSQDHWGFYNGIANTTMYSFIPNGAPTLFTGGDRRVKPENANVFALKGVTYPEGGRTEYTYEGNTADPTGAPAALLAFYQDDNLVDTAVQMFISSYSRSTSNPLPTSTDANGFRYFKQAFTVPNSTYQSIGFSWIVSTTFGISSLETTTPYGADNADFLLEKVNSDGSRTIINEFNTTEQNLPYTRTGTNNGNVNLIPGNYEMTVRLTYGNQPGSTADLQPYNIFFTIKWRKMNPATKAIDIGGLRIKNINYYTSQGVLAKSKAYTYIKPYTDGSFPDHTSGELLSLPQYYSQKFKVQGINGSGTDFIQTLSSNSYHPLETTSGSYCGYEDVDETEVDAITPANNLKTSYTFSFATPYYSEYYPYMNLAMWEPQEWNRGKLLDTRYFKGTNVIKEESFNYYDWSPHLTSQTGEDYVQEINTDLISYQYLQRISLCEQESCNYPADFYDVDPTQTTVNGFNGVPSNCIIYHYGADFYHVDPPPTNSNGACSYDVKLPYFIRYTGFDKPQSKTTTMYDDNGNSVSQTDSFFYEKTPSLYQMTRKSTINSKKDTWVSQLRYPFDFSTTSPYNTMIQRNIINPVIQQSELKNGSFVQSNTTNYQDFGNNIIAPASTQQQILTNSVDTRVLYNSYDNLGNLLEYQKTNDAKTAYLWDYAGQYPVCKAVNAAVSDIAYTSFEADGTGNWTIGAGTLSTSSGITGKNFYTLSSGSVITRSGLNSSRNYVVSYWSQNGPLTISGTTATSSLVKRGWTLPSIIFRREVLRLRSAVAE